MVEGMQDVFGLLYEHIRGTEGSRVLLEERCAATQAEGAALRAELEAAKLSEGRIATASGIVRAAYKARLEDAAGQLGEATARVAQRDGTIGQQRTQIELQVNEASEAAAAAAAERELEVKQLQKLMAESDNTLHKFAARVACCYGALRTQHNLIEQLMQESSEASAAAAAAEKELRERVEARLGQQIGIIVQQQAWMERLVQHANMATATATATAAAENERELISVLQRADSHVKQLHKTATALVARRNGTIALQCAQIEQLGQQASTAASTAAEMKS